LGLSALRRALKAKTQSVIHQPKTNISIDEILGVTGKQESSLTKKPVEEGQALNRRELFT
jgi:hypothetical protein